MCIDENIIMPGRILDGRCIYIPSAYDYSGVAEEGKFEDTAESKIDLGEVTLEDPNETSYSNCYSSANSSGSFINEPAWHIATVYEGKIYIGSASWFDEASIIVDNYVVPVTDFKIFCSSWV